MDLKPMKFLAMVAGLALAATACDDAPKPESKAESSSKDKDKSDSKDKDKSDSKDKDKDSNKGSDTKQAKADSGDEKADPAMDDVDIPVAADFEEKAEKEITKDNLAAEFAKLEKEVNAQ